MATKQELIDGFLKYSGAQPYLNQFEATGTIDMTNPEAVRALRDHNYALWELMICAADVDDRELVVKLVTQFLITIEHLSPKWAHKVVEMALAHPDHGDPSWDTCLINHGILTLTDWTHLTLAAAQEVLSMLSEDKLREFCWNEPMPVPQAN